MPSKSRTIVLALSIVACAFATVGCHTATVSDSTLPRLTGNDPDHQLDFWHTVATKPLISNDEAFHGLLLYLDNADNTNAYADRVAALKSRNLLAKNFSQPQNQALQRGTLAVPLAKTLGIKGGLTMRLTGLSPRYATRELEYKGVYPPSSPDQIFTGAEYVGVIGKLQDLRAGDPTNLPAASPSLQAGTEVPDQTASKTADQVTPILAMIQPPQVGDLTLAPPTTAATTQSSLNIVITNVEGLASVRENDSAPWKPATKGMQLPESAELRTGPRGSIQFTIGTDQTVSVDRLTTLKVLKVIQQGGKVTTDLGIKYGRTRYDLEGGGLEHQSTLRSPNATLAVRGTKVSLTDQPPFPPQAISLTGRAQFRAFRRQAIAFGNRGQGKTVVSSDSATAGQIALAQSVIDPNLAGARTESEAALLTTLISRGATVVLDRGSGIKIVHGGIPPTDPQLIPALPGRLNFVLRWNADANLDLAVSTPATAQDPGGQFIYPASGLNISRDGGKTAFDHRGGPNGGIELVYFNKFTDGVYALGGPSLTKGTVVTATLEAFLDGKNIQLFDGTTLTNTVTQTVTSAQPALALVPVNTPFVVPPVLPALPQSRAVSSLSRKTFASFPTPAVPVGPIPSANPKKR